MIQRTQLTSEAEVLGTLLHSLCQPLTTLRCSLELAADRPPDTQGEVIPAALEQADRAILAVQLIREYLEIVNATNPRQLTPLSPALDAVLVQLSVVAEVRRIPLLKTGSSCAEVFADQFWLRRALSYLIGAALEAASSGNAIVVALEDTPAGTLLIVKSLSCSESQGVPAHPLSAPVHLRDAHIAIANRILAFAGIPLEYFDNTRSGFILRIPRAKAIAQKLSA